MNFIFDVESTADWLKQFGIWSMLISVLFNVLISILGLVPSVFLSGANAVVFGIIPGFFISLVGETAGAAVSFYLYRWGVRKIKSLQSDKWNWTQQLNKSGRKRKVALLFIARLTPLIPSGVITFAASISGMRFVDFVIVTLLGKAPSIALETLVGHDLFMMEGNWPRLFLSVLLFLLMIFIVKKKQNHVVKDDN